MELTQHIGEMQVEIEETNFHIAKFDLTPQAMESDQGLSFVLDYSTALFKRSTAEQIFASLYVFAGADGPIAGGSDSILSITV